MSAVQAVQVHLHAVGADCMTVWCSLTSNAKPHEGTGSRCLLQIFTAY